MRPACEGVNEERQAQQQAGHNNAPVRPDEPASNPKEVGHNPDKKNVDSPTNYGSGQSERETIPASVRAILCTHRAVVMLGSPYANGLSSRIAYLMTGAADTLKPTDSVSSLA